MVLSAIVISLSATAWATLGSLAFYALLIYLEHIGIVTPVHGAHYGFQHDELIRISIFFLISFLVAFQGYYYISRVRKLEKDAARLKDEFLFRAVHDLRIPVNATRWILDRLTM